MLFNYELNKVNMMNNCVQLLTPSVCFVSTQRIDRLLCKLLERSLEHMDARRRKRSRTGPKRGADSCSLVSSKERRSRRCTNLCLFLLLNLICEFERLFSTFFKGKFLNFFVTAKFEGKFCRPKIFPSI